MQQQKELSVCDFFPMGIELKIDFDDDLHFATSENKNEWILVSSSQEIKKLLSLRGEAWNVEKQNVKNLKKFEAYCQKW